MQNTPLSVAQRDQLADMLAGQLAQRQSQVAVRQGQESFVDHAETERQQDSNDVMQRDGAREVDGALSARDFSEIANLSAALGRIHGGIYGICTDCGASIGFARLMAQPEALRCAACAAKREAQHATD